MPTNVADDFSAFAGKEHMFFGLHAPFEVIRSDTEAGLRKQVPDTELEAIVTRGEPKFLTVARERWFSRKLRVTHFCFCVRAQLRVSCEGGTKHFVLDAALTFLFGGVQRASAWRSRIFVDIDADAERAFTDDCLAERFRAFRSG